MRSCVRTPPRTYVRTYVGAYAHNYIRAYGRTGERVLLDVRLLSALGSPSCRTAPAAPRRSLTSTQPRTRPTTWRPASSLPDRAGAAHSGPGPVRRTTTETGYCRRSRLRWRPTPPPRTQAPPQPAHVPTGSTHACSQPSTCTSTRTTQPPAGGSARPCSRPRSTPNSGATANRCAAVTQTPPPRLGEPGRATRDRRAPRSQRHVSGPRPADTHCRIRGPA